MKWNRGDEMLRSVVCANAEDIYLMQSRRDNDDDDNSHSDSVCANVKSIFYSYAQLTESFVRCRCQTSSGNVTKVLHALSIFPFPFRNPMKLHLQIASTQRMLFSLAYRVNTFSHIL